MDCISSTSDKSSGRRGRPDPASISDDVWETAQQAAWQHVLLPIHPTLDSDEKRKDVTEYVQTLLRTSLGIQVFPYGSVPLKTYLPDGDIDLTALSTPNYDNLSRDVLAVLNAEQLNEYAEYQVRDTQFIDAEVTVIIGKWYKTLSTDVDKVKLVKCHVENIAVDISINQLGGLTTLCFLEQVDRFIGKDHLFKRSIILIKAWCYYESRILGAHHGLISTYALESLILYIFHLFNSSLNRPLEVLYRFLVYFSKFDWENYCISLNGPVCMSFLPDIVAGNPENEDLMLSKEFLRNCVDMFSISSRSPETNVRAFPRKHLNIIDPVKENNNLGRSVNRGNYFRILSAFKFGARKLGNILLLPKDKIADEIKNFFENTLERHGHICALTGGKLIRSPSSIYLSDGLHLGHNGNIDDHMLVVEDYFRSGSRNEPERSSMVLQTCHSPEEAVSSGDCVSASDSMISSPDDTFSDSLAVEFQEKSLDSIVEDIKSSNLCDLSGDYDSHIRSLLYGQCCHGYSLSLPVLSSPHSSSAYQFQNNPWDTVRQHLPLISEMNSDSAAFGQSLYPVDNPSSSVSSFGLGERTKARGTGTYIPNLDRNSFRRRPFHGRRNQGQATHRRLQRYSSDNMVNSISPRTNSSHEGDHKDMKERSVFDDEDKLVRARSLNSHGISIRKLEFGSLGSLTEGSHELGVSNLTAGECSSIQAVSKEMKSRKEDRDAGELLNLQNEEEFPPLTS